MKNLYLLSSARNPIVLMLAIILAARTVRAVDLSPYVAEMTPLYYQGSLYTIDVAASTSSNIIFDQNNSVSNPPVDGAAVPYFELQDLGWGVRLAGYVPAINGSLYYGSDPGGFQSTLMADGFSSSAPATSPGALSATDSENLQGVYQVGLWIFGALLMLPIILKVKPT
jgi:hypothetical protein